MAERARGRFVTGNPARQQSLAAASISPRALAVSHHQHKLGASAVEAAYRKRESGDRWHEVAQAIEGDKSASAYDGGGRGA